MKEKVDPLRVLERSRALWNRNALDLESDEVLAQILDRGSLEDWRLPAPFRRRRGRAPPSQAGSPPPLGVPTRLPHFWLAVLAGLGHEVDWTLAPKVDAGFAEI